MPFAPKDVASRKIAPLGFSSRFWKLENVGALSAWLSALSDLPFCSAVAYIALQGVAAAGPGAAE